MARGLGKNKRGFANSAVTTTVVTTSPGSSNVALYLPFDSDLNDDSTNAFTGTVVNSASISTSVKKFGSGSLDLVSSGKYVNYPYNSDFDLGSDNWTFEAWIYLTTSDDASIFSQGAGGSGGSTDYNYAFKITNNTPREIQFFWNGGDGHGWSLNPAINVWNHVALVREGNLVHCFLNGVKGSGSANFNVTVRSLGSDNFSVGHSPLSGYRGYIDDFRFIKGIALYTSDFTPPTSAVGLTGGFEVTNTVVDNKFLSSVWSLKDQNKKISKGEWIRNDAADTGVDGKGRSIKGSGLEVSGHRHFQGGNVKINAIGAGGHIGGGTPNPSFPGNVAHNEMFGGFTSMEINITPGTPLNVIVGGGGEKGPTSNPFGGGGAVRSPTGEAGSGGGYSGVFEGPVSQGNAIAIAGGGGGGRPNNAPSGWSFLFNGDTGAGGGLEGNSGGSSAPAVPDHVPGRSMHGTGGTQSAGGVAAGFLDGSPVPSSNQGDAGSALQGGNGAPAGGTGGGGGGYYGGGAGWADPGFSGGGGGGGGSSYITPAAVGSPYTVTGGANGTLPTGLAGNSYGLVNDLPPSYSLKHGAVEIIDGAGPTVYTYTGSTQTHTVT